MHDEERLRLRDQALTWRAVEGEVIALDRRSWAYLSVNDSGALLWESLAAGATAEELAATLAREFGVDAERARDDVERFLAALRTHGLLDGP